MKNVHAYSLDTLDDKSLGTLYTNVCQEINSRAEAKVLKRAQWVDDMVTRFLVHPNANVMKIGEITIVAVYDRYNGTTIGRARPVNGDEYNAEIGLAVAFAKACDETVPDYI